MTRRTEIILFTKNIAKELEEQHLIDFLTETEALGISIDGPIQKIKDRVIRFRLRKRFGEWAANWNPRKDNKPKMPDQSLDNIEKDNEIRGPNNPQENQEENAAAPPEKPAKGAKPKIVADKTSKLAKKNHNWRNSTTKDQDRTKFSSEMSLLPDEADQVQRNFGNFQYPNLNSTIEEDPRNNIYKPPAARGFETKTTNCAPK